MILPTHWLPVSRRLTLFNHFVWGALALTMLIAKIKGWEQIWPGLLGVYLIFLSNLEACFGEYPLWALYKAIRTQLWSEFHVAALYTVTLFSVSWSAVIFLGIAGTISRYYPSYAKGNILRLFRESSKVSLLLRLACGLGILLGVLIKVQAVSLGCFQASLLLLGVTLHHLTDSPLISFYMVPHAIRMAMGAEETHLFLFLLGVTFHYLTESPLISFCLVPNAVRLGLGYEG